MSTESLYKNQYGYFSKDGKEYVITDYKTPKPWVNVISNGSYGLVISQTGGGFSWLNHSEFNRVNRWHQDMVQDNWGKYFYFTKMLKLSSMYLCRMAKRLKYGISQLKTIRVK
ncbi:MAG: hypothetical protein HYV28_02825 [Ignavibacteriales bacterium]|nr:hypothetical protein [Ignavibacteriales bacterium]